VAWMLIHFELRTLWNPDWTYAFPQGYDDGTGIAADYGAQDSAYYDPDAAYPYGDPNNYGDEELLGEFSVKDGLPIPLLKMTYINKTRPRPCDKEVTLYELNEDRLYRPNKATGQPKPVKGKLSNCHESECERPFSVQLIPHTNLILIVADKLCPCFSTKISINPDEVTYGGPNSGSESWGDASPITNSTEYCKKLKYNIFRRKPTHCYNYHPEETEIKLCGGAGTSTLHALAVLAATAAVLHGRIR